MNTRKKTILIRNVPGDLHKDLRRWALDDDTSLNALAIAILTRAIEAKKRATR